MKRISLIFLVAILCFAMTACVGGDKDAPSGAAEALLNAIKEDRIADIEKLYQGDANDLSIEPGEKGESGLDIELEKLLVDKLHEFEFEIIGEEKKDDKATVEIEIRTYEFGEIFSEVISEYMSSSLDDVENISSEEEMNKMLTELFKEKFDKAKLSYVKVVKIDMFKTDEGWQAASMDDYAPLVSALKGGMDEVFGSGVPDDADNDYDEDSDDTDDNDEDDDN